MAIPVFMNKPPRPPVTGIRSRRFPDSGFGASLTSSNEVLFCLQRRTVRAIPDAACFPGTAGDGFLAIFPSRSLGWDKKTIYLSSHGGVFIRKEPGTLDLEYLQTPGDRLVNVTVADPAGNLWLGTSEGVLRYQPSRIPPVTKILASSTEVRKGVPLPVMFRGLRRFEKENNPASFRYSWRIDNGHWSPSIPGRSKPCRCRTWIPAATGWRCGRATWTAT